MIIEVSSPQDLPLLAAAVRKFRGIDADTRYARSSGALAFVATEEGARRSSVGAGAITFHRPDGFSMLYLHDVEVDEPYRRRGVGRRLVEAFMDSGRRAGTSKMFLTTGEANILARRLYEGSWGRRGGVAAQGPTVKY